MPADSSARRGARHTLRKLFYSGFYRLPARWRRRLVRLIKQRFTVGAVVLVRTTDPDRLLLLRQPPGNGWSLPAGLMDRGERPIQCAVRELAEETGIRLTPADLEAAVPNVLVHKGGWIDCVFHARVPPDTAVSVDGAEVYEAVFHSVDALPPLTVPTARLLGNYGLGPYTEYPETRST
jgi:8-oxo-dGTP pyrophosphatase MutT (NUDIX family)